jgi:hypothetical protein
VLLQALGARDHDGMGYVTVDDVTAVMAQCGVFVDREAATSTIRQLGIHVDQFDKLNYKQLLSRLSVGVTAGESYTATASLLLSHWHEFTLC